MAPFLIQIIIGVLHYLSCTGKLLTACLNCRLSCYVEDHILGQEQAGFREGYSTIDHIFVLQLIIELYKSVHKRVYCASIDYGKAFDSINRPLLWQKLAYQTAILSRRSQTGNTEIKKQQSQWC